MIEKLNHEDSKTFDELREQFLAYITERMAPDRTPYNSKFAPRTLSRRIGGTEQQAKEVLAELEHTGHIKILKLTNNLRGYRPR